jgi:sporulation protein YlmC with PRC-barrel domain
MKFSKLEGLKAFSSEAALVGEVVGADIDTKKWRLTHLHIELADDAMAKLGYKKPILGRITINLPSDHVKTVGDVVTLNRTLPELKKVPPSE